MLVPDVTAASVVYGVGGYVFVGYLKVGGSRGFSCTSS